MDGTANIMQNHFKSLVDVYNFFQRADITQVGVGGKRRFGRVFVSMEGLQLINCHRVSHEISLIKPEAKLI